MEYRKLGKYGIKVSEISLGTMYYGSYITKEDGLKCLHEAINQEINFIDCADRYGIKDNDLPPDQVMRAEAVVGDFLEDYDRADLVLSSKIHHQLSESPNSGGLSRKHIKEGIQESLKYMKTEYLDLYFCHRPDMDTPLEETIRTMTDLVEEGLIHYWGTSWWPPHLIERTIGIAKSIGCIPPVVEQPPYHMRARFIEPDLFEVARYHGLGITAFEALSLGLFTGKYNNTLPEDSRLAKLGILSQEQLQEHQNRLKKIDKIAQSLDLKMYQLALAYVLYNPEISSTIMGASKPEQVEMNASASGIKLTKDTIDQLNEINEDRTPKFDYRYS